MGNDKGPSLWTLLVLMLAVCSLGALNEQAAPGTSGDNLRVRAARRAEKFVDNFSRSEVRPRNPMDVVLFVELAGISVDDFQKTPKQEVFVTAGERRFEPNVLTSGDWQNSDASGKPVGPVQEDRFVVAVVPRDTLTFTLHFGGRPAIAFKATPTIVATVP